MIRTIFTAFVAVALSSPAQAQGPIPQPVIEQCNAEASASNLPECLKSGAIAFEMMEMVKSDDAYGASASAVLDACMASNDTYETAWVCFENAAEKAAETRDLIGLENIADSCVAAISDPAVYARIEQAYQTKRKERFPDEMFFGGTMYHAFTGCAEKG